jgi:hypothetical protein
MIFRNPAGQLMAVHARHPYVRKQRVKLLGAAGLHRSFGTWRGHDFIPGSGQREPDEHKNTGLVVHDENPVHGERIIVPARRRFLNGENCPMRNEPETEVRFQCGVSLNPAFDSNAG